MEMSLQGHSGLLTFADFHIFFFTLLHTLHTLLTQSQLFWPNMGQSYQVGCLKECALHEESKYGIIRVISPLIRPGVLNRDAKCLSEVPKAPQHSSASASMIT